MTLQEKGSLVHVVWDDVEDPPDSNTWMDEEDVFTFSSSTTLVNSVGWVVSHTEKYLTLAADRIDKLVHYGRVTKITNPQIIAIVKIDSDPLPVV